MAQKKITDLALRSSFDGTVNLPGDDSSQTYRVTGAQIATYIQSVIEPSVTAVSANYAVLTSDRVVTMSASGGNRTVTLPTAVTFKGKVTVKKIDTTSNTVQILTTSSQTIDQYSSGDIYLRQRNESITFYSDGSNWIILDHVNGYNSSTPAGSIQMYGGSTAPVGWQLCDGSAISRTTYAELFRVLSTTFGSGDGSSTFNVPDMRGVFAKGAGTTSRTAGKDANGNFYAGTLGTYSTDKMQGHYHSKTDPGHYHAPANSNGAGGSVVMSEQTAASGYFGRAPTSTETTNISITAPSTDGTNGTPRTGGTTEPQSLGLTYIIKL